MSDMETLRRKRIAEQNAQQINQWQTTTPSAPTQDAYQMTITTKSGKQYSLDRNTVDWIQNRYQNDWAGSYGYDDADQAAMRSGQMSAAVRKTYGKSNLDRQLMERGLPSEKNLEKYIGAYQSWHTGGINDVFGDSVSPSQWTKMKDFYKQDWKYEDTAEDQERKRRGLMPAELEKNYGDTEIDDQLKAGGLPSMKDFNKYLGLYSNYSGVDALYANAAGKYTATRLMRDDSTGEYIQNDNKRYTVNGETRTGKEWYAKAFYDELGRTNEDGSLVYGDIMPLLKSSKVEDEEYIDPTKSFVEQMDKKFAAKAKAGDLASDFANYQAFSYDDFVNHYDEYYDRYYKNQKFENGQTVDEVNAIIQRERDEARTKEFYTVEDKWFDGDKGIDAFIDRYQKDYPVPTDGDYQTYYEDMFANMLDHGISLGIVRKTMKALRKDTKFDKTNDRYNAITDAFAKVKAVEKKKQQTETSGDNGLDFETQMNLYGFPEEKKPNTIGNEGKTVSDYEKELNAFIDQSTKEDENDEDTIERALTAVKNGLSGFMDQDEGIGYKGTVDDVIKVIQQIEDQNWNNPAAMRKALEDYGFSKYANYSGLAADLTANWSEDDKIKLATSLGDTRMIENDDKQDEFDKAYEKILGDWAATGNSIARPNTKLDHERFNYAMDWARDMVENGRMSDGEAYNILAGLGFQDELQYYLGDKWHEAHYKDVFVPKMYEQAGGDSLAMWEGMTPDQRKMAVDKMWSDLSDDEKSSMFGDASWWKSNPTVYRTFGQALEQQFAAVLPSLSMELASGAVTIGDAIGAAFTGRPAMGETAKKWQEAQQFAQSYGSVYDEVNGAKVADIAASATGEIAKMYLLGGIGGAIGEAVEGTKIGSVIAKAAAATNANKVTKFGANMFLDMVKASPFMVSSFAGHYSEAKSMGATNGEAAWYGMWTGLAEGALEGFNFDKVWGRALGTEKFGKMLLDAGNDMLKSRNIVWASRGLSMIVGGLGEATEENLGYALETVLKLNSRWGADSTEWDEKERREQGFMGFLTGLVGAGLSSGAINQQSIMVDYWLEHTELPSHIIDTATGTKVFESGTSDEQAAWRNGDARIMSDQEFASKLYELDILNKQDDTNAAQEEYKKREDQANKKYNAVKAIETNLRAEAAALDPEDPEYARKLNDLDAKITKAAQDSNDAALVREDEITKAQNAMDTRIEQAHNQRDAINKAVRDHFAGIYLQNEDPIIQRNYDAIKTNLAKDRQNGATVAAQEKGEGQKAAVAEQPGLWRSKQADVEGAPARPFTADDEKQVVETAKKMRYKGNITFVDDPEANWEGRIHLKSGDIEINRAHLTATDTKRLSENPAMWVMEHELFHYMWNRGGNITDELRSTVREMYKKHPGLARGDANANYDKFLDNIMAKRNEQGLTLNDRAAAEEEVIADFFRNYAFRSEAAIKALCQTNGNLGQRILSWLRYKIDDMKLRRSKESWARDILNVERQYALALREAGHRPYSEARAKASNADETAYSPWVAYEINKDTTHGRSYSPGDYDFTKPFEEQVDDFLRADTDPAKFPTHQDLLVSGTPTTWQELGISNIPITYGPGHLASALSPNADSAHAITAEEIKQLPKALENPVAIIASDSNGREGNSIVVFVDMKRMLTGKDGKLLLDRNGKQRYEQRMAAVKLDGHQQVNGHDIDSLHISSFYAKPASLLKTALDKESMGQTAVFYLNKKSAAEFLARAGVQFPGRYQVQDGINHMINENGSPVKGLFKEQTETEQFQRWFGSQKDAKTGEIDPSEISKFKNPDNSPRVMYKVPGTTDTYKTTPSSEGEEGYYISANRIVTPKLMEEKLIPRFGSKEDAIEAIKNDESQKRRGLRVAIREDLPDGSKQFKILNPANAKSANENIGLFDRSYSNPLYSAAGNLTDDILNGYVGQANPDTGVTGEEDEAYMRAALAGDVDTAGRMVRDMYERNGLMHVYRGEPKATGSWTQVDMNKFKAGGMFASTDIDTARANEYTGSYAKEDLKTKPLSYGDEMPILQRFADGVANRIGRGMSLQAESYYIDDESNTYTEGGKGREHHWALRDVNSGDIFADSTELSTLADAAKRKAARLIGGNAQNIYNSISDPFAGRILDLFVKFDRANEHNANGDEWDKIYMNGPKGVTLYRIEVTDDQDNPGMSHIYAYPIDEGLDAESSSASERAVKSVEFTYDDADIEYAYKLEQAFKELFGPKSDVSDFFFDNAEWTDDGAVLNKVGVRDKNGRYVSPALFPEAEVTSTDALAAQDKGAGYDGSIIRNVWDGGPRMTTDTVSFNPNYIKSADAITYDDNGNIIPLSQRGDFSRNDLRYSGGLDIDQILTDMAESQAQNQTDTDQQWDEKVREYGAKPQGQEPRARDIRTPERPNAQKRFSDFLRSLVESDKVGNDQVEAIKRKVLDEDWLSYIPVSQQERMEEARAYIAQRQPLEAQQDFHDMVTSGKLGVKTNALGLQLLSDAAARGDIESVLNIATDLQIAATEAGQSAQIFNVLKELKGVGSAWYMNGLVKKLNTKYADRIQAGKMDPITVPVELMENLSKAVTVDEIASAEEAVAKEIARQLPLTWEARLSNWRYFSMLANPTTHFRNITGNVLMKGLNAGKDVVATGLEKVLNIDESERAHATLTSKDKSTWGGFAEESYKEQAKNLSGGGKLSFKTFVDQNMRSFDTKWLNALAQFNFKALEGEDIAFIRPAYKNALMQYMKAQGFTLNENGEAGKVNKKGEWTAMTNAQKSAAVDWASQQAWKATFRDASSLATMLNKLSKEGPVARLLVEGVMPFKKTPINIARRGIEYSPAGIVMGTTQLLTKVKQGKMTAAQAIDNLASGITGTALMALGVALAKAGLIRAGGEKDKKLETYLEDTGDQTYAMKFGDKSINMSSIAPATIPLFMGVALNEMIEQSGETIDLSTITDTIAGTLNPFMEMSFMASLNSALKNYNNNGIGGALGNTILTAAQNYGSQYLPTLGGKIAQFIDPTRRTTKSDATSAVGGNMDYYLRSLAKKVPGLEATLQPDVDVWGRTDVKDSFSEWAWDFANKFILPTTVKVTNRDAVDNELIRVVESTGVTDFLPSDGNKYFTVKGERYTMNAKQYAQYSQERGQAAYVAIKELMASPSYQAASDETKADMLKKAKEAAYKQVNNLWKEKLGAFDK